MESGKNGVWEKAGFTDIFQGYPFDKSRGGIKIQTDGIGTISWLPATGARQEHIYDSGEHGNIWAVDNVDTKPCHFVFDQWGDLEPSNHNTMLYIGESVRCQKI